MMYGRQLLLLSEIKDEKLDGGLSPLQVSYCLIMFILYFCPPCGDDVFSPGLIHSPL